MREGSRGAGGPPRPRNDWLPRPGRVACVSGPGDLVRGLFLWFSLIPSVAVANSDGRPEGSTDVKAAGGGCRERAGGRDRLMDQKRRGRGALDAAL